MPRVVPSRLHRRRVFLRTLAEGETVVAASQASGLKLSTLYIWRRRDEAFRAAWEEAATVGGEAQAGRLDAELMRRAVEGVDETVYRAGVAVGTRKRYSDPLLLARLRELRPGKPETSPPAVPLSDEPPRIKVVLRRFGPPPEDGK